MSGDYGVNFIKPFSYISFNEKLPSIQNSIKEYSNTIDDGVNHLKIDLFETRKPLSQIKIINSPLSNSKKHKKLNSKTFFTAQPKIRRNFIRTSDKYKFNNNHNLENDKEQIKNESNINKIEIDKINNKKNQTLNEFHYLTDRPIKRSRNLSGDLLNTYDSFYINQYFLTTLKTLTEDAIEEINNINYDKKEYDIYENKMMKKCNKKLKKFNDKLVKNTNEYLTERIKPEEKNTNKHFDKLILSQKNFDVKSMMRILRERRKTKNKILHENQFKAIEKKHKYFMNMIEMNEIEAKRVRKTFEKLKVKY